MELAYIVLRYIKVVPVTAPMKGPPVTAHFALPSINQLRTRPLLPVIRKLGTRSRTCGLKLMSEPFSLCFS